MKKNLFLFFWLIFIFSQEPAFAQNYGSATVIQQIKRDLLAVYDTYLEFEKELNDFDENIRKKVKHSELNISFKKPKDTNFKIRWLEILIDQDPVFSDFYDDSKNNFLEKGGRQLIYYSQMPFGTHKLTYISYVEDPVTGAILEKNDSQDILVIKNKTSYYEIIVSGESKKGHSIIVSNVSGSKSQ